MPDATSQFQIPQRVLLSVQVAAALRAAIGQGQWVEVLPSERQLSEQLHVSRPTVRAALRILAQEGGIVLEKNRRPRIASPRARSNSVRPPRKVLLVTHKLPSRFSAVAYHGIHDAQEHLARHGLGFELFVCKTRGLETQLAKLGDYIRRHGIACCVLATVQKRVQQWFAARSLPALVLGSCHPSVELPSFDVEHKSVGRHAAGVLLGKGHRRVAMIVPTRQGPGHMAGVGGFLEAFENGPDDATPLIVRHDETPANLTKRVNALFARTDPPTGLVVTDPRFALLVMVQLLRKGLSIPRDVSLIARDQDPIFNDLTPRMAHYVFDPDAYAKRISRLILRLVDQKQLAVKPNLLFPRFVPGGTVCSRA
jgi:DNA-binding LacI/PurR family transcriptional regulator